MSESDDIMIDEIFANATNWEWPLDRLLMPKPWDGGSSVLESSRHAMTRLSVQAKVVLTALGEDYRSVAYRKVKIWLPNVKIPECFYGFNQVVWKNIYECGMTSDGQVRMDFIKPDGIGLTFIKNRGCSVNGDAICRAWQEKNDEIAANAALRDPEFRLDEELVHIFAFNGLVNVKYCHGMEQYKVWFNFGNNMVYVEGDE